MNEAKKPILVVYQKYYTYSSDLIVDGVCKTKRESLAWDGVSDLRTFLEQQEHEYLHAQHPQKSEGSWFHEYFLEVVHLLVAGIELKPAMPIKLKAQRKVSMAA